MDGTSLSRILCTDEPAVQCRVFSHSLCSRTRSRVKNLLILRTAKTTTTTHITGRAKKQVSVLGFVELLRTFWNFQRLKGLLPYVQQLLRHEALSERLVRAGQVEQVMRLEYASDLVGEIAINGHPASFISLRTLRKTSIGTVRILSRLPLFFFFTAFRLGLRSEVKSVELALRLLAIARSEG